MSALVLSFEWFVAKQTPMMMEVELRSGSGLDFEFGFWADCCDECSCDV